MNTIHCKTNNDPAAIERLLRVVRLRGFTLNQLQLTRQSPSIVVAMTVIGERAVDNLIAQLSKLHSIEQVWCEMDGAKLNLNIEPFHLEKTL